MTLSLTPARRPSRFHATDRRGFSRAFSLIEVVIALGITSFTIISLFGLLSIGLRSSKESSEDTTSAMITQSVIENLRASNGLSAGLVQTNYYDFFGQPSSSNAYYRCVALTASPTNTVSGLRVRIEVAWPWTNTTNNEVFETVIAR